MILGALFEGQPNASVFKRLNAKTTRLVTSVGDTSTVRRSRVRKRDTGWLLRCGEFRQGIEAAKISRFTEARPAVIAMDRKHAVMSGCTTAGATSGRRPETRYLTSGRNVRLRPDTPPAPGFAQRIVDSHPRATPA